MIYPSFGNAIELNQLFKETSPSVVVIHTLESMPTSDRKGLLKMTSASRLGSGVLISKDGKILTAAHVVHMADKLQVQFKNGKRVDAKVISSIPALDIALLKIDEVPAKAKVATLANSDSIQIGDRSFVIGAPYGNAFTLTVGYISGRRTKAAKKLSLDDVELIQTDASINKGNSGGPIYNMKGEVIGIVSHINSKSGGSEGLGFAVSVNMIKKTLLVQPYMWSGITWKGIGGSVAKIFNIPQNSGILIERVAKGSSADKIGLKGGSIKVKIGKQKYILGGDIILSIDNIKIENRGSIEKIRASMLEKRKSKNNKEFRVPVLVMRAGKKLTLEYTQK